MITSLEPALPFPDAPYRGIRPFRFLDQQLFTARDEEIVELLSKVTLYRAVLLYGDSGTGKSSLINAGLIPEVRKENFIPNRLRVQPFAGREIKVERMLESDGSQRVYLPSSFTPIAGDDYAVVEPESFELPLALFRQQLKQGRQTEPKLRHGELDAERDAAPRKLSLPRPLLIFDQFEEFITLFEEVQRGDTEAKRLEAAKVQRRIFVTLIKLIRNSALPVKLVFVFREDYFAKLNPLFEYCPELLDQAQRLLPPHLDTLPEIIRAPFANPQLRVHFLRPTEKSGSELSEAMAKRIAADLSQRSEGNLVNLSELQIVCLLLWRSPDPEERYEKRGVQGLLEDYGSDVFRHLQPELQDKVVALLATMLTTSNTRNIISEADLKLTAKSEKLSIKQYYDVIDKLCSHQIVRRERHRNLYFYELASEYLVPWINKLAADRELLRATRTAQEERRRAEGERRRALRFQRLLIVSGILLAVLLIVGGFAAYFYRRSVKTNKRLDVAEQKRTEAEKKEELALQKAAAAELFREQSSVAIQVITGQNDAEKLEAIDRISNWVNEGTFPPKLIIFLLAAQSTTENQQIRRDLSQVLARAAQTDVNLSQSIGLVAEANTSLAEKLPLQFNIYLADNSQRGLAQRASSALTQHGYVVLPGGAVGEGAAPDWDNELRYFRRLENGQELADILRLLKTSTGSSNWKIAHNPQYANSPRGRAGQLELWFAKPAGHLDIGFTDEDGKPLDGIKFTLIFEPADNKAVRFKSSAIGVTVPNGEYDVTISVKDYKDLRKHLSITANQKVEWYNLKLTREKPGP
ncbi:MAG TPA: hypothetical protein VHE60_04415 [Pyrinomonadaceae bacterium]|nr:hypothetical protein [Pyrinomonadaceae bacterium]